MDTSFQSKVLLFGEYSVIQQSMALSTPYPLFEGRLTFPRDSKFDGRDPELLALVSYLKKLEKNGELDFELDISSFGFDVAQGLIFDSSIPQGFGVGSSGALCAAIYDRYCMRVNDFDGELNKLKARLSLIESHFHGSSSGIDPLISYLNCPILIEQTGDLRKVCFPKLKKGAGGLFLLNTGRSRKTEPLVNLFLEKCKIESFNDVCLKELLPITNQCITYFLEGQMNELIDSFYLLSRFQYKYFAPMIPKLYRDLWSQGLDSQDYLLKLCGAGGGGFLIGVTRDFKKTTQILSEYEVRPLFRFS